MLCQVSHTLGGVIAGQAAYREQRGDAGPQVGSEILTRNVLPQPLNGAGVAEPYRLRFPVLVLPGDRSDGNMPRVGMQRHNDVVASYDLIREPPELARPVGYHVAGRVRVGRLERPTDAFTGVAVADIAQFGPADEGKILREGTLFSFAFFTTTNEPCRGFGIGGQVVAHTMDYAVVALLGVTKFGSSNSACRYDIKITHLRCRSGISRHLAFTRASDIAPQRRAGMKNGRWYRPLTSFAPWLVEAVQEPGRWEPRFQGP